MAKRDQPSDDRLVIIVLAAVGLVCIVGVIMLRALKVEGSDEALVTIGSLAVGALASRISQQEKGGGKGSDVEVEDAPHKRRQDDMEDDFAVIGRAATKQIIAEAMRQMGSGGSAPDPEPPTT